MNRDSSLHVCCPTSLACSAPTADILTDYDEVHLATYLSLLHASAEGAEDADMCRDILGIDPQIEPERAEATLRSHLARARWLSSDGRQQILKD